MLEGRQILIVEDDFFLAQDLCRELEDAGAVVLGPEPSVARAMSRLANTLRIDAAVLDVNLGGEMVFPVAEVLAERHVPTLFATGYHEDVIAEHFPGAIVCPKPLNEHHVTSALHRLMSGVRDHREP